MYEIYYREEGQEFITTECFYGFDDAVERAETVNAEIISDTENFDDYVRCNFCKEWVISTETDKDGYCEDCIRYLRSRGEEV